MEMDLSPVETTKLNNLWRTSRFQHSWRTVQNIVNCRERVTNYFVRNMLMIVISCIAGTGLFLSQELGILSNNIFWGKIMVLIARLIIFLIVLQILSVLIYSFIGPAWEAKQSGKLRRIYEREILEPILQVLYPSAKIDTENDISPNNVEEVVPVAKYYIQSGIINLSNEKNVEIVDLYAYSMLDGSSTSNRKIKNKYEISKFIGQVYSIKNTKSLKGNLRIVPTKHFLLIETQGDYLDTMSGGRKINVEYIQHNEHYNIYCTDEQSARMFLTPNVIKWFNNNITDHRLSLYSKDSHIYIADYNNKRLFSPPKDKSDLSSWRIERTARDIKYVLAFAGEISEII